MPSKSSKQARMMAGAAHDPAFAKKVGVPQAGALASYLLYDDSSSSISYYIAGSHNYGIVMNGGTYAIAQMVGNGFEIETNGTYLGPSDARLKHNIAAMPDGALNKVMALKPSTFVFNAATNGKTSSGLIAQDANSIIPEAFDTDPMSGEWRIEHGAWLAYLTKALQELNIKVDTKMKVK